MEVALSKLEIPHIEGLNEHQVATLVYCRTYEQFRTMLEGYRAGKCAFCDPLDPEKNRIVLEAQKDTDGERTNGWRMWLNPFPLDHTFLHLVMAPKRHVAPGDDITLADFEAMGVLFLRAQKQYGLTGGGFVMRFGTPLQSSGTVLHLHANIIIPDLTGAVEATFAKDPEKFAVQVARMHVFMKRYNGTRFDQLSEDERILSAFNP